MTRIERLQHIVSPCQNVCKIENDVCIGCFRTLDEISSWIKLSKEKRAKIIKSLEKEALRSPYRAETEPPCVIVS